MSRQIFTLGNRCLIAYLAFLGAFAPLSIDMFLPALPTMTEALHTTAFGGQGAWAFALLYAPISCCTSAVRPPSTVLMMNQLRSDNGTVTALINSGGLLFGSLSMLLCSLPFWNSFITAAGVISFCVGGLTLLAWLGMNRWRTFAG